MMTVLLIATIVLIIAGLAGGLLQLRQFRQQQCELLDSLRLDRQRLQQLEQEVGALCSASAGAGDHVLRLEQQVHRIVERQNSLELRTSSEPSYNQASQLIDKGADVDQLVGSCGLTRGEAELLLMMQRGVA
ncbi:MAG TPA: DUF2802 domain-containing protein [Gammaproteobacteria bacterium]|nr:DUF2802 domain-containing protein [Gammaproteobacteria bacterium]